MYSDPSSWPVGPRPYSALFSKLLAGKWSLLLAAYQPKRAHLLLEINYKLAKPLIKCGLVIQCVMMVMCAFS